MSNDFRYAFRQLARAPGFTLVAAAILAVGIGANTAVYSIARAVIARPVPGIQRPERLVWVTPRAGRWTESTDAPAELTEYAAERSTFEEVAAMERASLTIAANDVEPGAVQGQLVTAHYFSMLAPRMTLGRGLPGEEDHTSEATGTAVISHALWRARFRGDSAVIGQRITINATPFVVVGVAAEDFHGPMYRPRYDIWIPLGAATTVLGRRGTYFRDGDARAIQLVARLAPGVTPERAAQRATAMARRGAGDDAAASRSARVQVTEALGGAGPEGRVSSPIVLLSAGVGVLIFLMVCANVTNMTLSRAIRRRREIAIRLALGAGRRRVIRQLLCESLVLSALAAAMGVLLAVWTTVGFGHIVGLTLNAPVDPWLFAFAACAALATTLASGVVPALSATGNDVAATVRSGGRGVDVSRARLQRWLVVGQVTVSTVLLSLTGIFAQGILQTLRGDPGFEASSRVLVAMVDPESQRYTTAAANALLETLEQRVRRFPGVEAVSLTSAAPFTEQESIVDLRADPRTPGEQRSMIPALTSLVRPGYFHALSIPIIRGRDIVPSDGPGAPLVAIVSAELAQTAWPDSNPLGHLIYFPGNAKEPYTVVGVVASTRTWGSTWEPRPSVYTAQRQESRVVPMALVVRGHADARDLTAPVRALLRELDPTLPVSRVATMDVMRRDVETDALMVSGTTGAFGALALLLAAIGLYAVMAFTVLQRTRDIGIRLAIGASPQQVGRVFVNDGMRLAAIGIGIGAPLSFALGRVVSATPLGAAAMSVGVVLPVALVLGGTAFAAAWMPAHRAARVDPLVALRDE